MVRESDQPQIISFGLFEVDLRAGELRKNGAKIKLQDQPFRVLIILLRRAGTVVTREELRRELWPTDTFVDFDHGLNAAVRRLRDALDDSAENPRFIQTLPRHGYRFITASVVEGIESRSSARATRLWVSSVVAAVLLIALAFLAWGGDILRHAGLVPPNLQPQINSIAVLPLVNLTGDKEQENFVDGMTEQLITELSRIGPLKVISRTSVMQYKGEKNKTLPQIGRELNVDAVMEGSVLRAGNRVRIATHMIDASTDQNLMVETYEGDLGDILKIQREVAESISAKVRITLTPQQKARLRGAPKVDPEAYQAYLTATRVDLSGYQGIKTAENYLLKSIEKDPNFAQAYTWLAITRVLLGAQRWQSAREAFPSAKEAIHKALELDDEDCEAHGVLARISFQYDWDWEKAEKEYRRALELCPNNSRSHFQYGVYSAVNGRFAEAQAKMAATRELDPIRSEPFVGESVIHYHRRNYKALVETSRAFLTENSNDWRAHNWLGVGYQGSGQTLEAISEYQKAVELSQGDSDPTAALAHAYTAIGRKAEAAEILHRFLRQSETSYASPYMIATIYAGLGAKDKAFEYLEKAYQERSSDLSYFLRADLRIDNLRSDPRFQDLMSRINFPEGEFHQAVGTN
ncbi:MAG TPA: tetratricopeptide repeat protein [Terriglobales bacterium]|jgi:TolB-like protein/DNA-binding winged helix-turn-helix (wHTH) protein/Tfp pilus assembly protein PilF|nr:tetratricopeptide repeat protein [Terriglobales bacterium]